MRRRRSRLPLIVPGGLALLVGATLGIAAAGVRPAPELLMWLGGRAAAPATASGSGAPDAAGAGGAPASPSGSSAGSAAQASAKPSDAPGPSPTVAASPAEGNATPRPSPGGATASPSTAPGASAPPAPQTASGTQARAVYNGSRARKIVAITFDDGYNPVALRQILAILKREHVVATFFPYGWAVHKDPAGWKMVVAAGYPIGNHTLSHATLTRLTPDQVTTEMVRGHRTIDLYSGAKSINLMRPPGGAFNAPTAIAIAKAGYNTIVMWDVDTFDWQGPSAATILARATRGTNGSIVLMHSGPMNTPKALPAIIANYRARGFTFVTIPVLLATH